MPSDFCNALCNRTAEDENNVKRAGAGHQSLQAYPYALRSRLSTFFLLVDRRAEDESKIEELEVARTELEEKLRLSEAKKMKLEQRVNVLSKQNAALAKGGQATTKEGLDAVNAQLKGYSKGMEVMF